MTRIHSRSRLVLLPLVIAIVAMIFAASPARAGENIDRIYQKNGNGDRVGYGQFQHWYEGCAAGNEVIVAHDYSRFGILVRVFARKDAQYSWTKVGELRSWEFYKEKCVTIPEGFEVKLSVWQYNGSDEWSRKDGYGTA